MGDDRYLWDRSGPPDPEVERLERRLAGFRGNLREPAWPAKPAGRRVRRPQLLLPLAAAAILVLAVAIWQLAPRRGADTPWAIARVDGELRRGAPMDSMGHAVTAGRWIETAADSRALLTADEVGQISVEPGTRLRVVVDGAREHRLQLAYGTLRAVVWAPPGRLVVDTPSSTVVDLGCAYTLRVDAQGVGVVEVTAGWVAFAHEGRESFIPAGAVAESRPDQGPGTPYFEDVSVDFRWAVTTLDRVSRDPRASETARDILFAEARPKDALTLWHLLARVEAEERSRFYDRLAELAPPPAGVTRVGIRRGDREMLDRWWNALGYGDLEWWRTWLQQWRDVAR